MISRRLWLGRLAAALASAAAGALPACIPRGSDGRIEVSLWFSYGGKNRETLLGLVERFNADHPEIRVRPTYQGDYFEGLAKLRTALAARAAPVVTHVVGEVVPYLSEAGVLEPLDGFAGAKSLGLVTALAQDGTFVGGADRPLVALPFNRSTPIAYFSRRVLDDLGLAPPRTWDELRNFARAATRRDPNGTASRWGFECPVDWWFWVALVGQAGGTVVEADGTPSLGGEAGVEALSFWQSLVHDDRTMKPPPGRDYNSWQVANTDFLAGRAAMIWTSTAFLRYLEDNAKFEVVAAPLPSKVRASVPTGGTFFVMPRGSSQAQREAGWTFLRWMMAPAQASAFATKTGYIPVSEGSLADLSASGWFTKHPNDRVAVEQLGSAMPWPWAPELFRVQREAVQPRLEEAVLVPRDARRMLDEARKAALDP